MPKSSSTRVKNQSNTLPPVAGISSEATSASPALEIDEAGIRILIDFFQQLKKWDTLQSTFNPLEAPDYCQDIAA